MYWFYTWGIFFQDNVFDTIVSLQFPLQVLTYSLSNSALVHIKKYLPVVRIKLITIFVLSFQSPSKPSCGKKCKKFDKGVLLKAFWKFLKELSKVEWARTETDELLLERIKRTLYSRPAELKFSVGETSSETCKETNLLFLKHMVHQQRVTSA